MAAVACHRPDPRRELEIVEPETYWVVDATEGEKLYLAPAVRFSVRNKGAEPRHFIEAQAVFRRAGETEQWGSDWKRVTPPGKPLDKGQTSLVVLRSDGRYYSTGRPEDMFQHALFKDASVQVFLRVGSSAWDKFADMPIERRVGSRAAKTEQP